MKNDLIIGFDRDGTIIFDEGYFGKDDNWEENLKFYPDVFSAIKNINKLPKTHVFIMTNQEGVARGYYNEKRVDDINNKIIQISRNNGAIIERAYFCPYVSEYYAIHNGISLESNYIKNDPCFKPGPGMLIQAARDLSLMEGDYNCIFIGDRLTDGLTGINNGGIGVIVKRGLYNHNKHEIEEFYDKSPNSRNLYIIEDLHEIINIIQTHF